MKEHFRNLDDPRTRQDIVQHLLIDLIIISGTNLVRNGSGNGGNQARRRTMKSENKNEIIIYQTTDGAVHINVQFGNETVEIQSTYCKFV